MENETTPQPPTAPQPTRESQLESALRALLATYDENAYESPGMRAARIEAQRLTTKEG